jgi:hypothetical protein
MGRFRRVLTQDDADAGNNFVYGAAFVATEKSGTFTWGKELAVNLLVRPFPNSSGNKV